MYNDDGSLDVTLHYPIAIGTVRVVVDQGKVVINILRVRNTEESDLCTLNCGQIAADGVSSILLSGGKRGAQSKKKGRKLHVGERVSQAAELKENEGTVKEQGSTKELIVEGHGPFMNY